MRFVLEEASWAWDGTDHDGYIERIEQLLDRVDVARERGERYAASRELLQQTILGTHCLYEILWDQDSPLRLPHEVCQRVNALFGSIWYWDDEMEWLDVTVNIEGCEVVSPSALLARLRVSQGQATACLALPGTWAGPCEVVAGEVDTSVHFVVDELSHRAFFRDALRVERVDEAGLQALAPHAFPDLFFLDGVWEGIRLFQGGYARVREDLHRLLAVLDDYGAWVFTDETGRLSPDDPEPKQEEERKAPTNQIIERRFKKWGFEFAPENRNVKADGTYRRARERVLRNRTLYCEWHYKFERHVNRAHIHPPIAESGHRLIVAIFRDHLPLPGDG